MGLTSCDLGLGAGASLKGRSFRAAPSGAEARLDLPPGLAAPISVWLRVTSGKRADGKVRLQPLTLGLLPECRIFSSRPVPVS